MVGANTFREPALTAKLATTLDHISGGRAILGIGAAWFEEEHQHFGLNFGEGFPERLRWLGEALPIMRGMLDGTEPTATGPRYKSQTVRNLPAPVQKHLPIFIGGGGEQVTLKLVAKYGDGNNVGGTPEEVAHKEEVLLKHCAAVGRNPDEIERTVGIGTVVIRNNPAEAQKIYEAQFARNGISPLWENQPVGSVDQIVEQLAPYVKLGYKHLVAGFSTPHDEESLIRFAEEVKPQLEKI
jgi:alkanesulfonate monooxygenase SsuD/methylene tetrahydromethanopterin reductase-like flavin-dependent oxidoreductase (luciferase family)